MFWSFGSKKCKFYPKIEMHSQEYDKYFNSRNPKSNGKKIGTQSISYSRVQDAVHKNVFNSCLWFEIQSQVTLSNNPPISISLSNIQITKSFCCTYFSFHFYQLICTKKSKKFQITLRERILTTVNENTREKKMKFVKK